MSRRNIEIDDYSSKMVFKMPKFIKDIENIQDKKELVVIPMKFLIVKLTTENKSKENMRKIVMFNQIEKLYKLTQITTNTHVVIPVIYLVYATLIPIISNIFITEFAYLFKPNITRTTDEDRLFKTFVESSNFYTITEDGREITNDIDSRYGYYISLAIYVQYMLFELISNVYVMDPSSRVIRKELMNEFYKFNKLDFKLTENNTNIDLSTLDFTTQIFCKTMILFGKAPVILHPHKTAVILGTNTYEPFTAKQYQDVADYFIAIDLANTRKELYTFSSKSATGEFISIKKYLTSDFTYTVRGDNKNSPGLQLLVKFLHSYYYLPVVINRSKNKQKNKLFTANHEISQSEFKKDDLNTTRVWYSEIDVPFTVNGHQYHPFLMFGKTLTDGVDIDYCFMRITPAIKELFKQYSASYFKTVKPCKNDKFINVLADNCIEGNLGTRFRDNIKKYDDSLLFDYSFLYTNNNQCKSPILIIPEHKDEVLCSVAATVTLIIYLSDYAPDEACDDYCEPTGEKPREEGDEGAIFEPRSVFDPRSEPRIVSEPRKVSGTRRVDRVEGDFLGAKLPGDYD
jgi:hypothetical protein